MAKTYGGGGTRAGKLTSRLPLIVATLDEKTLDAVKVLAERIAEGAKDRVPDAHPLGEGLVDAIHVETEDDLGTYGKALSQTTQSVAVVAGDYAHFYGHIVENGGVYHSPHPFLIPAFEVEQSKLNDIAAEALKDL